MLRFTKSTENEKFVKLNTLLKAGIKKNEISVHQSQILDVQMFLDPGGFLGNQMGPESLSTCFVRMLFCLVLEMSFMKTYNYYIVDVAQVEMIIGNLDNKAKADEENKEKVESPYGFQFYCINVEMKGKTYKAMAVLMSDTLVVKLPLDEDDSAPFVLPVAVRLHDEEKINKAKPPSSAMAMSESVEISLLGASTDPSPGEVTRMMTPPPWCALSLSPPMTRSPLFSPSSSQTWRDVATLIIT